MTYSGVLFVCTVLGLMLGNLVFNPKDGLLQMHHKQKQRPGVTGAAGSGAIDDDLPVTCPCGDDKTTGVAAGSANSGSEDENNDNQGVPDGATPCCQYTA